MSAIGHPGWLIIAVLALGALRSALVVVRDVAAYVQRRRHR